MPGQAKAAIVGATVGAVAAVGYVQQEKQLRQLAARQTRPTSAQPASVLDPIQPVLTQQDAKIQQLETMLRKLAGQPRLTPQEITQLRSSLPHSQVRFNSGEWERLEQLEARLDALAARLEAGSMPKSEPHQRIAPIAPIVATAEPEATAADEAAQAVIEWFNRNQIEVENYYEPDPTIDTLLDNLCLYLGDNYGVLSQFHWKLRTGVGRRLHFNLGHQDARGKSIHNQYLKQLKSSDYLSIGKIVRSPDSSDFIIAASHIRPDIQGFFNGGWFERFVYYKTVELLDSEGVDYQYLRNPKIVYPDQVQAELDLFFLVNGKPLLIECKAGQNYDEGITRFVSHRERLNLDPSQVIFVVLDIGEAEAHIRTRNWDITVADQTDFIDRIQSILPLDNSARPPAESTPEGSEEGDHDPVEVATSTADDSTLESFFKQRGLNQAPEFRTAVFEELVCLIAEQDPPMNFIDISKTLRDRMKESAGLGRNKINELLNCLRYSDLFRDDRNKPVRNVSKPPIIRLASVKPTTLERKCMEFYAGKILQLYDPDFFDLEENIQEFERLTLGKAPASERIRQLKDQ